MVSSGIIEELASKIKLRPQQVRDNFFILVDNVKKGNTKKTDVPTKNVVVTTKLAVIVNLYNLNYCTS